jgi:ribosomal protein L34E
MRVISLATQKLVEKIKNKCPQCATPGFEITKVNRGLPCELCKSTTQSTLSVIYGCKKCNYLEEIMYPKNKKNEDPMYCDYCNP